LKPDFPLQQSQFLTFASAWGLATSLQNLRVPVRLKWPNDLVLTGKKLGGLLIESHLEEGTIRDVVIGLGLNGFNPMPPTGISVQQAFQPDLPPPPLNSLEGLSAVALYGLIQGYLYWQSFGDRALLNAYRTQMANIGQRITFNDNLVKIMGIASSGNLQVQECRGVSQFADPLEIEPGKVSLGYNA
jgi:BirA family biotin operon repressor/biotin-[acetyl-CoA-carboxylase] ligase